MYKLFHVGQKNSVQQCLWAMQSQPAVEAVHSTVYQDRTAQALKKKEK